MPIELNVNGRRHRVDADTERTLLSVLREELDLTGTKYGCGEGPVRRLHGAARREGRPLLPDAGRERRGQADRHDRGARARRPPAPGAAGVPRRARDAVRLLHAGDDHGRRRAAGANAVPTTDEIVRAHGRQRLPLRHVPGDRRRDQARRVRDGSRHDDASRLPQASGRRASSSCSSRTRLGARSKRSAPSSRPMRRTPQTARSRSAPGSTSTRRGRSPSTPARSRSGRHPHVARAAVAEELRVPVESIRIVMGDTDLTPFDLGTFGSRSTPQMGPQLGARPRRRASCSSSSRPSAGRSIARSLLAENGRDHRPARPSARSPSASSPRDEAHRDDPRGRRAASRRRSGRSPARRVPQGRRARLRHRHARVHVRHAAARDAPRQGAAPAAVGATLASLDTSAASAIAGVGRRARRRLRRRRGAERRRGARARWRAMKPQWTPKPRHAAVVGDGLRAPQAHGTARRGRDRAAERAAAAQPFVQGNVESAIAAAEHKLERTLHGRLHRARAARAARGGRAVEGDGPAKAHRLDRHAAAVRRARRAGARARPAAGARPRDRARHRLRLRRQAHRRGRDRGGAAREGAGQAGQARLDARGGVHLGVLPARRRHRRRAPRVRADGTITAWKFHNYNSGPAAIRPTYASPTSTSRSTRATRRCARARTAGSPRPRTTSRARCTWTSWRAWSRWTRSRSG